MKIRSFFLYVGITVPSCSFQVKHRAGLVFETSLAMLGPFARLSSIPNSPSERDNDAIEAIKSAIKNPKTPSFPLIECEFPPLAELNKLGDGSLRSANQVDDANLAFCAKLARSYSPFPMIGPKIWLLTSASSSVNFFSKASRLVKGVSIVPLKDGLSETIGKGDFCIVVSPSSRQDYLAANKLASGGFSVVIVNGFIKDQKSINAAATMAYFLKPLTYNSQVAGYLVRKYPNDWATIDLISKKVLASYKDDQILFQQTNSPDLRGPGRLVQKSVDERAIRLRNKS